MSEPNEPASAAVAARELAKVLLDQADALDLHDLRATVAIEQVRVQSRVLADAVHERGWGDIFLGIDSYEPDDLDDGDLDPSDFEPDEFNAGDDYREFVEGDLDDDLPDGPLVPEHGIRLSYQARYDFVVTDPEAFVAYVRERAQRAHRAGTNDVVDEIHDAVSAFELIGFMDGIGSKEYDAVGLSPAGGEESHKIVDYSLWDLDPTRRDDTYPY
ncbi:MAG: hypothetical protein ACRDPR_15900 [Nocardioidaceae bacterium]